MLEYITGGFVYDVVLQNDPHPVGSAVVWQRINAGSLWLCMFRVGIGVIRRGGVESRHTSELGRCRARCVGI